MKIAIAVIILLSSLAVSSQSAPQRYDSLSKYSYLMIGASFHPLLPTDKPSLFNLKPEGFATGFFLRQGNRLFLVSAYHVLTTCDVYNGTKSANNLDYMVVRYPDTTNNLSYLIIPIYQFKETALPIYFLQTPDIAILEVTGNFQNGGINSIENIVYAMHERKLKTKYEETFLSYGFPNADQVKYHNAQEYITTVTSTLYEGKVADSTHWSPVYKSQNIDSMCWILKPEAYKGTSGAPFFKLVQSKRKEWIEFAGVQSGTDTIYHCAYVVKTEQFANVVKKIPQLK